MAKQKLSVVTLVHSSDLHIDMGYTANKNNGDGTVGLRRVLEVSSKVDANLILLAGDVFEHNRLSNSLLDQVAQMLSEVDQRIVILPGNHDPLTEDSVYRRGNFDSISNVSVLGLSHETSVIFEDLDIEIWGNAHIDYGDMNPLKNPVAKRHQWHVAMAHGHYNNTPHENPRFRPSWLFGDDEIKASNADYIALGHWDVEKSVGPIGIPTHYCGSPEYSRSVNVVKLCPTDGVIVERHLLV